MLLNCLMVLVRCGRCVWCINFLCGIVLFVLWVCVWVVVMVFSIGFGVFRYRLCRNLLGWIVVNFIVVSVWVGKLCRLVVIIVFVFEVSVVFMICWLVGLGRFSFLVLFVFWVRVCGKWVVSSVIFILVDRFCWLVVWCYLLRMCCD